jgi:hypothetical protein
MTVSGKYSMYRQIFLIKLIKLSKDDSIWNIYDAYTAFKVMFNHHPQLLNPQFLQTSQPDSKRSL